MKLRIVAVAALLVVAVASAGCVREPLPAGWRVDTDLGGSSSSSTSGSGTTSQQTFESQGATRAAVNLNMGAGEMIVGSGDTSALAEATFEYGSAQLKPETSYKVSGSTGTLQISQPDIRFKFGESNPNSWDVALGKGIAYDLNVQMGAGTSQLNLSELDIRHLVMRLGAGETTVNLTGPRAENLTGDVQAGVGQLTIVLPSDVGVKVTGRKDGIGTFEADGFKTLGNSFVNDAYGNTPTSIELNVMRGVGEVKLELQ